MEPIDIINKSVLAHGGLEQWKELKSLSFTKKTTVYHEDGSLGKESLQNQEFVFSKSFSGRIYAVLDSILYHYQDGNIYVQRLDSSFQLSGEELKSKQSLFKSALYVTSQPFQLLESGATFERKSDTVFSVKKAFAIRIHYPGDSSTSDQWTYYFDQASYRVVACKVRHNDRVSIIENTSYDMSTPFVFNATRKSTIMDWGKPKFVIAEYEYSNYKISF